MTKIVVLVSGGGTNLQAIMDKMDSGAITNAEIVAVISNKADAYALERARNKGIAAECISPKSFASRAEFNEALLAGVKKYEPDLIVLAGYLVILPACLIQAYPQKILNIHPSLIPAFCGMGYYGLKVHQAAIDYGVKLSGATVHFVSADVDGGAIIMQRAVEVECGDTAESLQARILKQEHVMLPLCVKLLCQGKVVKTGRSVNILE